MDLVGGTSMGAILSATFAMGLNYEDTLKLARQLASPLKLFDPTVPVVSFFASGKVTQVLERIYGDTQIEDLWMPCFCVSSNLTHAVAMVHRRGPLWQAVRASMAIPGVFSPILAEGDLLVDGCVLNNLPIDVMQRLNHDGPIIAVNVFPDVDLLRDYHFGPSVSGWQALAAKLNPLRRRDRERAADLRKPAAGVGAQRRAPGQDQARVRRRLHPSACGAIQHPGLWRLSADCRHRIPQRHGGPGGVGGPARKGRRARRRRSSGRASGRAQGQGTASPLLCTRRWPNSRNCWRAMR